MPNSDPDLVTTTLQLPHALWVAARTRAAERREDLRSVVIRALERELRAGPAARAGRARPKAVR
jgi:hypothetical protein